MKNQNTSLKENLEYHQVARLFLRLGVPSLQRGPTQFSSSRGRRGWISLGPPEMLQKPVLEKPSTTLGQLENSGLLRQRAQRS